MFNKYSNDFGKTKQNREPAFTLKEFSKLVDIPYNTILNRMKRTEVKPEVQLKTKTAKYYKYSDLTKWNDGFIKNQRGCK